MNSLIISQNYVGPYQATLWRMLDKLLKSYNHPYNQSLSFTIQKSTETELLKIANIFVAFHVLREQTVNRTRNGESVLIWSARSNTTQPVHSENHIKGIDGELGEYRIKGSKNHNCFDR